LQVDENYRMALELFYPKQPFIHGNCDTLGIPIGTVMSGLSSR